MWFIIRCVFCIGLVFANVPGSQAPDLARTASALTAANAPALNEGLAAAFAVCESRLASCLSTARRLSAEVSPASEEARNKPRAELVGDTLTAADRAAPWRIAPKRSRHFAPKRVTSASRS